MKAKSSIKADIIAGKIKVHDYMKRQQLQVRSPLLRALKVTTVRTGRF